MSKYEDTRIVTFQEEYAIPTKAGGTRVIYKKSTTHAMHKSIAKLLQDRGAKIKVSELDHKKIIEQRKANLIKTRKRQVELSYGQ